MISRRSLVLAAPLLMAAAPAFAQEQPTGELCHPDARAMAAVKALKRPVIEIGSGDGYWVRALRRARVAVAGYDIVPSGPDVILGDHVMGADAAAPDAAMLAVWPPDGPEVSRWIEVRRWPVIVLVGSHGRFDVGSSLAGYALASEFALPDGREGENRLKLYRRA